MEITAYRVSLQNSTFSKIRRSLLSGKDLEPMVSDGGSIFVFPSANSCC